MILTISISKTVADEAEAKAYRDKLKAVLVDKETVSFSAVLMNEIEKPNPLPPV